MSLATQALSGRARDSRLGRRADVPMRHGNIGGREARPSPSGAARVTTPTGSHHVAKSSHELHGESSSALSATTAPRAALWAADNEDRAGAGAGSVREAAPRTAGLCGASAPWPCLSWLTDSHTRESSFGRRRRIRPPAFFIVRPMAFTGHRTPARILLARAPMSWK